MTLGEISPSSASSAKCIGQKHQLVILGEISSSPPPVVSLLVLCLIYCPKCSLEMLDEEEELGWSTPGWD